MRALFAALAFVLLAGCSSPPPTSPDTAESPSERLSVDAEPAAAGGPWSQAGNVTLGWVAGVGYDTWLGDGNVGLTSHEACPRASFIVPRSATHLSLGWDTPSVQADRPGAGYYTLVVSGPDAIWFLEPQVVEGGLEIDGPAPGVWEVKVQPRLAAVNLLWTAHVGMEGDGLLEPPLEFFHDGDCLA